MRACGLCLAPTLRALLLPYFLASIFITIECWNYIFFWVGICFLAEKPIFNYGTEEDKRDSFVLKSIPPASNKFLKRCSFSNRIRKVIKKCIVLTISRSASSSASGRIHHLIFQNQSMPVIIVDALTSRHHELNWHTCFWNITPDAQFSFNILCLFRSVTLLSKIIEKFQKISTENCKKCIILAYFSKCITKHPLIVRVFGRKTQFIGNIEKKFEKLQKIS